MLRGLERLRWDDPTDYLPAFLVVVVVPMSMSITEGIAFGFIACSLLKLVTGRGREVHWGVHALAALLVARYAGGLVL